MTWLGLDIGGANLKAADCAGWARTVPFSLWRMPERLPAALEALLDAAPAAELLAVTMTGELCDCFRTKVEGVRHILNAVEQAADGRELLIYLVDGQLASLQQAREVPHLAMASNWHALARFVCRFVETRAALLIDIGSTTTDIIPIRDGRPCPRALDDTGRLVAGELVYSGVIRTPVSALTPWLPWRGARCPVACEHFATAADAYVLLDQLAPDVEATWTADGRPLTKPFARGRLARMVCADTTTFDEADATAAADHIAARQSAQLRTALCRVVSHMAAVPETLVTSGVGEFLVARVLDDTKLPVRASDRIALADRLGAAASEAAPAHAVAVLAREANLGPDGPVALTPGKHAV